MCYFLTIGVNPEGVDFLLQAVPHGLEAWAATNPSISRRLGSECRTFLLTSGMCSCDLYRKPSDEIDRRAESARRKYERLGWSDAKISRALDSKSEHAQRHPDFVGLRADVRELLASVAERAKQVVVVAHFFGNVTTDTVDLLPNDLLFSPDELRHSEPVIPVDQVVRVRARKNYQER